MLRAEGQERDTELLFSRLRHWRQAPELRGKVHTLVGGSIGLEGVLRRAGLSGTVNDLTPFRLDSWDQGHGGQISEVHWDTTTTSPLETGLLSKS